MKTPPTAFGRNLRNLRKVKYLTLSELAQKLGVKKSALQRIEVTPDPNPQLITLQKLAGALGVSVAELVKDVPVIEPVGTESLN